MAVAAGGSLPGRARAAAPQGATAEHRVLDDAAGGWVEPPRPPVRPFVVTPDFEVFAVHPRASTLERFAGQSSTPLAVWRTVWAPVAVAHWTPSTSGDEELLVAGAGHHVLARHRRADGRVLALVSLPHEPADLVVSGDRAFIACAGAGSVVQLDLVTGERVEYDAVSHPRFLCAEPVHLALDAEGRVLVAPRLSGNGTSAERALGRRAGARVLDLDDPAVAVRGLPDEDLFRIDPDARTVAPVLRASGTVLFGHGVNPATGRHWQLATEARNADPAAQSEAALRGAFVENRLAISALPAVDPAPGAPLAEPETTVDLDDVDPLAPGVQHERARALGQPVALAFRADGRAWVAGLLADALVELDAGGERLGHLALPAGSQPRAVAVVEAADGLVVWCDGPAELRVFRLSGLVPFTTYRLSADPTPPAVAAGRRLFYDGSRSLYGNASCASCHVDGRTDGVVWSLGLPLRDDKGPMVTQTLVGLARTAPYHWRGERATLADFNGAFAALLGGPPLAPAELEAFEAFVHALAPAASPHAAPERVLDDARVPARLAGASAVRGQAVFHDAPIFSGTHSCADCHTLPLGTNHGVLAADADASPKRVHMKVAPFTELWRRLPFAVAGAGEVEVELLTVPGDPSGGTRVERRARRGAGLTHAGLEGSLASFLELFPLAPAARADVEAFLLQLDTGLAPLAHRAWLLDAAAGPEVAQELATLLAPQAAAGHVDAIAFGTAHDGAGERAVAWAYDRTSGRFVASDPALAPRTLADFVAAAPRESHVVAGLPPGLGRRLAIDRDLDGLVDAVDPAPDVPAVDPADAAPPAFVRAPLVRWRTQTSARVAWETDEPCVFELRWSGSAGASATGTLGRPAADFTHVGAALATGLSPSTASATPEYPARALAVALELEVRDRAGNATVVSLPPVATEPFVDAEELADDLVVGALAWRAFDETPAGGLVARVAVRLDHRRGGPPAVPAAGRLVLARVVVEPPPASGAPGSSGAQGRVAAARPVGGGTFRADLVRAGDASGGALVLPVAGPFLAARPTGASGGTELAFRLDPAPDLAPGARVRVVIEAVLTVPAHALPWIATELALTEAAVGSGGPFDADTDGDGVPDACALDVPTAFAPRAFTRWSFAATPPAARELAEPYDPARPTRIAR